MNGSAATVCLVFAKPPGDGGAKTRLASAVGAEGAALLAGAFLRDTWDLVCATSGVRPVLATTDLRADHGLPGSIEAWDQGEGDLGGRLERLCHRALRGAPAVLAIGSDAPGMPPEHLARTRDAIARHEAVIGRAADGGFWAVGLRVCPEGLFSDLPWSSSDTAAATIRRLRSFGLAPVEVDPWWDVDIPADLERWRLETPRHRAPRTHEALDTLTARR